MLHLKLTRFAAIALAAAFLVVAAGPAARAEIVPTILSTSSPAYPGYPQGDAIDTGVNRYLMDFASAGQGTRTHLDFDFGKPVTLNSIVYTDRTSSGSGNGTEVMGNFDFVTEFRYIFAKDAAFTDVIAQIDVTHDLPACDGSNHYGCTMADLAQFQVTTQPGGVTSQYLRWQVEDANHAWGLNPGAADFSFSAVPEPATFLLLGPAILGVVSIRRRRSRHID